jgi:hypothetical protein
LTGNLSILIKLLFKQKIMDRKTVFVIGAGASKEAGLPTGDELKSKIAKLLDIRFPDRYNQKSGDYIICDALRHLVKSPDGRSGDINPYLHEAWHVVKAMPQAISIDNFIDTHRDNTKIAICGKLAIVKSILDAEKHSQLYFEKKRIDSGINFDSLKKTWYGSFFQLLTENCSKDELKERFRKITLIIFNYDRCIEHFLLHALQNYYKFNEAEAAETVKYINIYHPYGQVGYLPSHQPQSSVGFGEDPDAQKLLTLANQIKTFAEGTDPDSSEILEIKEHMAGASHLVFLGFAFHKLNMQLIAPSKAEKEFNVVRCFATAYEVSDSNKEQISEQITMLYNGRTDVSVKFSSKTCSGFFADFWRSLAY